MAQYKVPQDVEADDKLIGPFSFRQFVYILIAFGLIASCIPLWQLFPLLIIIPMPVIFFLLALALPLKKDQPMETYLSAVIAYYLKPHNRFWEPGEPESTIVITAPKKTEEVHLKNIDQEEALHRLSFLADIVDTEGYAIKDSSSNNGIREDIIAEANSATDIFDTPSNTFNQQSLQRTDNTRHEELVNQMRNAIEQNNNIKSHNATITGRSSIQSSIQTDLPFSSSASIPAPAPAPVPTPTPTPTVATPAEPLYEQMYNQQYAPLYPYPDEPVPSPAPAPVPTTPPPFVEQVVDQQVAAPQPIAQDLPQPEYLEYVQELPQQPQQPQPQPVPSQEIIDLANNSDYSIETIAQQAQRINDKQDNEVYVSLH